MLYMSEKQEYSKKDIDKDHKKALKMNAEIDRMIEEYDVDPQVAADALDYMDRIEKGKPLPQKIRDGIRNHPLESFAIYANAFAVLSNATALASSALSGTLGDSVQNPATLDGFPFERMAEHPDQWHAGFALGALAIVALTVAKRKHDENGSKQLSEEYAVSRMDSYRPS
ncbi:MAG: hypothetical protein WCP03_01865 [Candidatus Saccharibacteria bacterium]